jgi:DNA-binding response OmpR family regulator
LTGVGPVILLVDHDHDYLDVATYALMRGGFVVSAVDGGRAALARLSDSRCDLVLLDVALPDLDGFDVCRRIHGDSGTPVIIVSGGGDEETIARGFAAGADDYVVKPVSFRLLTMRMRAVLSRTAGSLTPEPRNEIRIGDLSLTAAEHIARHRGRVARLSPLQFRILHLMAVNAGRIVTSERLVEYGWGYRGGDPMLLRGHISHIRRRLGLPQAGPNALVSHRSLGYSLGDLVPKSQAGQVGQTARGSG